MDLTSSILAFRIMGQEYLFDGGKSIAKLPGAAVRGGIAISSDERSYPGSHARNVVRSPHAAGQNANELLTLKA
jgi:hypothetical protein